MNIYPDSDRLNMPDYGNNANLIRSPWQDKQFVGKTLSRE